MLNKYEWELYLKAGGQQVVDMFNRNLSENFTQEYIDNIIQFHSFYCPSKNISQRLESQLNDLIKECKAEKGTPFSFLANNDGLVIMFEDFIKQDETPQRVFGTFASDLEYYTTMLSIAEPELFIPYYYRCNYCCRCFWNS